MLPPAFLSHLVTPPHPYRRKNNIAVPPRFVCVHRDYPQTVFVEESHTHKNMSAPPPPLINYVQYCCFFLVLRSTKIHEKRFRHPCLLSLMSRCTKSMQKIASLYSRYNGTYLHCINCIKDVSCFGYSSTDDTGERVHSDTS